MLGSEIEVYVSRLVPVREDCSWDVQVERGLCCMSCFPDRGEAVDDNWWCLLVVELCLDCLLNPISARIPNGCLSELPCWEAA